MAKTYTKASIIQFIDVGRTYNSLFEPHLPVTEVYFFVPEHGKLIYFDDQKKWVKAPQLRFHEDIIDAINGRNSGYFQGLTVEKRQKNDDLYIEVNPKYELLTFEQAAILKTNN